MTGVQFLASLWQARPTSHALMLPPGADRKYTTIHRALQDSDLENHLNTRSTCAATNVGADKQACSIVIEQDDNALFGAVQALSSCDDLNLTAFSLVCPGADGHDGSHTWILFDRFYNYRRLALLADEVRRNAGLPAATETWPKKNAIRLPFGFHRWTRKRGVLLVLCDHYLSYFDLDSGADVTAGGRAVIGLPRNAYVPPELPQQAAQVAPVRQTGGSSGAAGALASTGSTTRSDDDDRVITAYNATYDVAEVLRQYAYTDAGTLRLSRPDKASSAGVQVDAQRNQAYAHSPNDALHDGEHSKTPFNVYCLFEHDGDLNAAVRAAAALLGMSRDYLAAMPPPHFDTVLGYYDAPGVACCPEHKSHLLYSTKNNVWYCGCRDVNATTRNGYCSYRWRDATYTLPTRREKVITR